MKLLLVCKVAKELIKVLLTVSVMIMLLLVTLRRWCWLEFE